MKKVLIISPHFAPINAPDMQRVRLALPYLRMCGWEPVVLAVDPEHVEGGVSDPLLEQTYPADIRVVRVRGISPRHTRWARVGSLWLRCGRALRKAGEQLLRTEKFDLVFFSTTQFGSFTLGPRWKREFGVPYVLDYQDPWVNDHYARTGEPPPGGALKYTVSQWSARRNEPRVVSEAAAILAVSPAYGRDLGERHPGFKAARFHTVPFGAAEQDMALARNQRPPQPLVPSGDGCIHHVYTGRGGADLAPALTLLFRAFKAFRAVQPDQAARMRFHFIGTSYAPPPLGIETIMPVARAEGVEKFVSEHCRRVPYFEALHYLAIADAVMAIGSNDPGYSASKIFPCILARRPLLALFHRDSPVHDLLHSVGLPSQRFEDGNHASSTIEQLTRAWFGNISTDDVATVSPEKFAPFSAESMTRSMSAIFDQAIAAR